MITKKNISLVAKILIGLILMFWPQLSMPLAQASCHSYPPKDLKDMDSIEPLMINESLLIEDIKKAYNALYTQGDNPRAIVLQFGSIDPATALNENEVKPFNTDIQSVIAHNSGSELRSIDFEFRPHSLISLSALQKAFGDYTISHTRTNHTGSSTIYSIRFRVNLNGKNINIYVRRTSPDLTEEKIAVAEISIID